MELDKLKGFDPCFHGRRLTCPHVTGWPQNVVNGCERSTVCSHVTKWPSEAYGRMKATDFRPRPRWNVNHMKQLRIPKLHRNSLSRKVFGDTQWRTYQEFGELCKACRAETGSNFPCGVCNAWAIFFQTCWLQDFGAGLRALGLESISQVALLVNWGCSQIQYCCLFCILEFNFVWFSGNLRLSRILDDSSKRLCWVLHIYAARKGLSPKEISIASRESSRSWCTRPV